MAAFQRIKMFLALCFRIILGVMFLYAGIGKVIDPSGFARAIDNYRILPAVLVHPSAIILPWVELLAGAGLITGLVLEGSAFIISGLLLVFSCALGASLIRGLDISCGCFSTRGTDVISWWYIARDMALFLMGCAVLFSPSNERFTLRGLLRFMHRP